MRNEPMAITSRVFQKSRNFSENSEFANNSARVAQQSKINPLAASIWINSFRGPLIASMDSRGRQASSSFCCRMFCDIIFAFAEVVFQMASLPKHHHVCSLIQKCVEPVERHDILRMRKIVSKRPNLLDNPLGCTFDFEAKKLKLLLTLYQYRTLPGSCRHASSSQCWPRRGHAIRNHQVPA